MAFGVQEMAVGRIQVAKQCQDKFFASTTCDFRGLGFICKYSKILYTSKISIYACNDYFPPSPETTHDLTFPLVTVKVAPVVMLSSLISLPPLLVCVPVCSAIHKHDITYTCTRPHG